MKKVIKNIKHSNDSKKSSSNVSVTGTDIELESELSTESKVATDEEGHYDMDGVSLVVHKDHDVIVASDASH